MAGTSEFLWETGFSLIALGWVVLWAVVGGILTGGVNGYDFWKIKTKPLLGPVRIPPLVVMIFMGCIARNIIPWVYDNYNDIWATHIRIVCLLTILLRGGLELEFRNKGLIVFLYTVVPQLVESAAVMLPTWLIVGIPFPIAYALGFICAAVSPAVLVPSMLSLAKRGYGVAKGIPTTLMAASSFDDILAIEAFGVFSTLALNGLGGPNRSIWYVLFTNGY